METRICKYSECSNEFTPSCSRQYYCCVKCRRKEQNNRKNSSRTYAKKKKICNAYLRNIENEARKMGMSYGHYVAMMEMQKGV